MTKGALPLVRARGGALPVDPGKHHIVGKLEHHHVEPGSSYPGFHGEPISEIILPRLSCTPLCDFNWEPPIFGVYVSVNSTIPSLTKNGPKARVISTNTVAGLSLVEGYPFVVALKENRKKHRFRDRRFGGPPLLDAFGVALKGNQREHPPFFGSPILTHNMSKGQCDWSVVHLKRTLGA